AFATTKNPTATTGTSHHSPAIFEQVCPHERLPRPNTAIEPIASSASNPRPATRITHPARSALNTCGVASDIVLSHQFPRPLLRRNPDRGQLHHARNRHRQ